MINIAIIGMGVMGKNHYRVLKNIKDVKIIALCDPCVDLSFDEKLYKNVDELLSNEQFDTAIISVPTWLHKEIAIKCIEKGKNVFIEKPVASNVNEGYEILSCINKQKVKAAIGHVERFNPVVKSLKDEIADKEIFSINITRIGPFPPRMTDIGVLTDLAVHDIDLMRFVTGKDIKEKTIYYSKKTHHYEDNAVLSFKLEKDIIVVITTNWLTPFKKRKIEVATKEAYYEADLISQELVEYSSYNINNSYITRNCYVKKGEPLLNELQSFIEYLKNGNNNNLTKIEDSIEILKIIENN